MQVRFGNYLYKWNSAAVIVAESSRKLVIMDKLACVLLYVDTCYTDSSYLAVDHDIKTSPAAYGDIGLGYLIGFGKVGIEIILSVHVTYRIYLTAKGVSHFYSVVADLAV